METERKSITVDWKAGGTEGEFTARIATLDVIDHDGDVTLPGAFPEGKELLVSAYQHGSWMGALPVGKAVIHEDGADVIAAGSFNLKTSTGRDTYEAVKFTGNLQEWSYGFSVLGRGSDEEIASWAQAHGGAMPQRIIKKNDPYELSPVLLGAGINTQTLGIKAGLPYADEAEAALAAVNAFAERTKSLADLRRKEGRDLSDPNKQRIEALLKSLAGVQEELNDLLAVDDGRDKAAAVFLEFARINAKIMEEL
jgi:phage head maturation protease